MARELLVSLALVSDGFERLAVLHLLDGVTAEAARQLALLLREAIDLLLNLFLLSKRDN